MPVRRIALVSLFLLFAAVLVMQAQNSKPITYQGLTEALRIGGLSPGELTNLVKQRGVDFDLTHQYVDELRSLGADDDLLVAIKQNKRAGGSGSSTGGGHLSSNAAGWRTYSYANEGFRVSTPAEPQYSTSPVEGGYTLHAYSVEIPNGALLVGVVDYGTTNVSDDPYLRLEKGMNASLNFWKATLVREKRIGIDGYPGVEFEGDASAIHWFGRYFLVRSVLYEVIAGYPVGTTYDGLHRFADSFALIPRTR